MSLHTAEKLVIITEKLISEPVCEIIESCGATGYTVVAAGGKGSRDVRATTDRASVIDDLSNIKIEVIVNDKAMAEEIMEKVVERYFQDYSGIAYMELVEILRPTKFHRTVPGR